MNACVYLNFYIEYACHTIRCQIRLHSYFYVLLVAGSYNHFIVMSNKMCIVNLYCIRHAN